MKEVPIVTPEALRETARFMNPGNICRRVIALTVDERSVEPTHNKAVQWCGLGHIYRTLNWSNEPLDEDPVGQQVDLIYNKFLRTYEGLNVLGFFSDDWFISEVERCLNNKGWAYPRFYRFNDHFASSGREKVIPEFVRHMANFLAANPGYQEQCREIARSAAIRRSGSGAEMSAAH